jgi:hypothetical protein
LSETRLDPKEKLRLSEIFYSLQKNSLSDAIQFYSADNCLMQVTTFSRLLTDGGKKSIVKKLSLKSQDIQMITLQQINTEEQFTEKIRTFLDSCQFSGSKKVLIVQGQINPETPHSLVECTRYSILNQVQQHKNSTENFCIILVLQVPRVCGGFFSGFPGTQWKALHIDELLGDPNSMTISSWNNQTLHQALASDRNINFKQLISECIPKGASLAYKSEDLSSSRIVQTIETIRTCLNDDQVTILNSFYNDFSTQESSNLIDN